MKIFSILFLWTVLTVSSFGQTSTYIGKSTLDNKLQSEVLVDTVMGIEFILDTAHISILAREVGGDILWQTDPWKDNGLMEYRVKRPVIVYFKFGESKMSDDEEVIWVSYNNSQFGTIEKKTGKFTYMGQD